MDAVLGFVRAGLGLAVVPRMVADRSGPAGHAASPGRASTARSRWPTAATSPRRRAARELQHIIERSVRN